MDTQLLDAIREIIRQEVRKIVREVVREEIQVALKPLYKRLDEQDYKLDAMLEAWQIQNTHRIPAIS